jgi:ATP-binding cassette subfamily B protein
MKLFKLLSSMWRYIKKDKIKFYFYVVLKFVATFSSLFYGLFIGLAASHLISGDFNSFVLYFCLYDGFALIDIMFIEFFNTYLYNKIELNFMKRISKDLYTKALNLPVKAYDDYPVGKIVNRIYTDPDRVIELLSRIIRSVARILMCIFIIAVSLTISWIITLEFSILVISNYILARIYYPKLKETQKKIRETSDLYVADSTQVLSGVRDVKGLGLKKIMSKLMFKNVDSLYDETMKNRRYELFYYTGIGIFQTIFDIIIFITLGYFAYKGYTAMAVFISFQWYIWRLYDVTRELTELGANYQKVIVSMTRINELLDNELYSDEKFGKKNIKKIVGNIEFKDVDFAYSEDKQILNNLSLKIETGKKVAIVGKSGMGKSTLFSLLLRFYNPTNGEILIDDMNIEDFNENSLRDHISIIRQDPYIFNKTIKENFELVKEDITLKEIRKLCQKAYIDDYIMGLPNQYDTLIGEGGVNLSGGQKQRLAIARTLALDSKIILFDESTSALDNESQEYIKRTIDKLVKNHTVIIIAHRLSTIMDADVIHLIDEGKVIASGTHDELIKNNELYRKLYSPELMELNI